MNAFHKVVILTCVLGSLVSCGDERLRPRPVEGPDRPAQPDQPEMEAPAPEPPAPEAPGPTSEVITITPGQPHLLIAFRHESESNWQQLPLDEPQIEVTVHGPYRVVLVCEDRAFAAPPTVAIVFARTLGDSRTIAGSCNAPSEHTVTGTIRPAGTWAMLGWGSDFSDDRDGRVSFRTTAGDHDLLLDHRNQLAVRRDIAVFGDVDLGEIDFAQEEPLPFEELQFSPENAEPDEELNGSFRIMLRGTDLTIFTPFLSDDPWGIPFVPASRLRATDRQIIELSASKPVPSGSFGQQRGRDYRLLFAPGVPTSIALPDHLGEVQIDTTPTAVSATWASLPSYSQLFLSRWNFAGITHGLAATRGFIEAVNPTRLEFELADVPGFRPEWGALPTLSQGISFDARLSRPGGVALTSSIFERKPPMQPTGVARESQEALTDVARQQRARLLDF